MADHLLFGFLPLFDAAPLIVAKDKGFFSARDLKVDLRREASWATVRDKLAVGALDGAHLLAPLALAARLGDASEPNRLIAPVTLNEGGAAITLSRRLEVDGLTLPQHVAGRREAGLGPLTFAVVYPHALHNYLLRDWLAAAGVDPVNDVRITVAPPARMGELLECGAIDGFCAGEPWNLAAQASGVAKVAARASQLQPGALDKVFAFADSPLQRQSDRLAAVVAALEDAAAWARHPANRAELVCLLSTPEALGPVATTASAALDEIRFAVAQAPPQAVARQTEQMLRWGAAAGPEQTVEAASQVFAPLT
ncbi:ABC transporter substrate-binding protein [Caulobacter segnis]|uniref:ABC transporter substrate-binding protein n=1 Tax=Caulobacter segnis TaxID=88688 RepID=UPI002410316C|nr:ABC transporter substrate-binding protein [Caulobacter segnis]MDG2522158.1 ABC transporter substrate-binding protein [Caulobacter segnis]